MKQAAITYSINFGLLHHYLFCLLLYSLTLYLLLSLSFTISFVLSLSPSPLNFLVLSQLGAVCYCCCYFCVQFLGFRHLTIHDLDENIPSTKPQTKTRKIVSPPIYFPFLCCFLSCVTFTYLLHFCSWFCFPADIASRFHELILGHYHNLLPTARLLMSMRENASEVRNKKRR